MSEPAQQPPALPNPRVAIDRYDFFGFFLPGLILTSILGVWLFHVHQLDLSWITTNIFTNDTEIYIIFVLLLILVSYILGQLIATCSFIVHDKILQGKMLGYPYKSIIFDIHENKEFRRTDGTNYHRSILKIGIL